MDLDNYTANKKILDTTEGSTLLLGHWPDFRLSDFRGQCRYYLQLQSPEDNRYLKGHVSEVSLPLMLAFGRVELQPSSMHNSPCDSLVVQYNRVMNLTPLLSDRQMDVALSANKSGAR